MKIVSNLNISSTIGKCKITPPENKSNDIHKSVVDMVSAVGLARCRALLVKPAGKWQRRLGVS